MKQYEEAIKSLLDQGMYWKDIADRLGLDKDKLRKWCYRQPWYSTYRRDRGSHFKSSIHKDAENSIVNEISIKRKSKETFTPNELLEIHGLDSRTFKLKQVLSNEWSNVVDSEGWYNLQSKIIALPKGEGEFTYEEIAELLSNIQAKEISFCGNTDFDYPYCLIPLSDMHFGLNSLEDYADLQNDLYNIITKGYKKITIAINGDFFHVDNLLNTTEAGTRIDDIDFEMGVEYGYKFLVPLIEEAVRTCLEVEVVYLPGNHAPSVDYMFVYALSKLYPYINIDFNVDEVKCSLLGKNAIFLHHGDKLKNAKRLLGVCITNFAYQWGISTNRYLITGHFHHEKSLSESGMTHYQVQSPSKASTYDKRYGYITSEEGQMVFFFNEYKRTEIKYL